MQLNSEALKNLAKIAIQNGTEKEFIAIALDCIDQCMAEIARLNEPRMKEDT